MHAEKKSKALSQEGWMMLMLANSEREREREREREEGERERKRRAWCMSPFEAIDTVTILSKTE